MTYVTQEECHQRGKSSDKAIKNNSSLIKLVFVLLIAITPATTVWAVSAGYNARKQAIAVDHKLDLHDIEQTAEAKAIQKSLDRLEVALKEQKTSIAEQHKMIEDLWKNN
jgi:hypothetical protein